MPSLRTVSLFMSMFALLACRSGSERNTATPPPAAMVAVAPKEAPASAQPERATQTQPPGASAAASPAAPVTEMMSTVAGAASAAPQAGAVAPQAGAAPADRPDAGTARTPMMMQADKPAMTCPAMASISPGDSTGSLESGGARRAYVVHVPPKYKGDTPVPLLIDMHGLFGTGQGQRSGSGTAAVADREGFVVAYPDGIDNAWNVGPCCTYDRNVDDVAFMRALVDKLKTQLCIDASRVYATGVSMGGGMSHYLGCEAADTFAAVAPAAFDLLEENTCMPSRPIAVLSARGTADNIVPYAGGASTPPNGVPTTIHFRGAEGTFAEWARINGCTDKPSPAYDACQSYTACKGGVEVTLCTAQGGGHTYGDPERAWKMLSKYKLP